MKVALHNGKMYCQLSYNTNSVFCTAFRMLCETIKVMRKNPERMYDSYSSITFAVIIILSSLSGNTTGNGEINRSHEAVTSWSNLETFYVQVKDKMPFTYVDDGEQGQLRKEDYSGTIWYANYTEPKQLSILRVPQELEVDRDLEDKTKICNSVFNSDFFDMLGERAVAYNLITMKGELLSHNIDIYDDIYQDLRKWLNPYKRRKVSVRDRQLDEHVFRCVTQEKGTNTYKGYFISPIYRSWSPPNLALDGRFVFTSNTLNELTVFALAEEPALVNDHVIQSTLTSYYHHNTGKQRLQQTEPDSSQDTLCTLSPENKIRLCTLIMNARGFPGKIKFWPVEENVEFECAMKEVVARIEVRRTKNNWFSFLRKKEYVKENVEIRYHDWMIGCKAMPVGSSDNGSASVYYVSRGIAEYSAIVFKASEENQFVYTPYVGVEYVILVNGTAILKSIFSVIVLSTEVRNA